MTRHRSIGGLLLALVVPVLLGGGPITAAGEAPVAGQLTSEVALWSTECGRAFYAGGSDPIALARFGSGAPRHARARTRAWISTERGTELAVRGRSATRVSADLRRRALDRLHVAGRTTITLRDRLPSECGGVAKGISQASASFDVRRRGSVRISWDHDRAGDLALVHLGPADGGDGLHLNPGDRHDAEVVDVTPGRYFLFVRFVARLHEDDVDGSATKESAYTLVVDVRS